MYLFYRQGKSSKKDNSEDVLKSFNENAAV